MNRGQAVVGARVVALRDFPGIPKGIRGTICKDYGSGVLVRWDGFKWPTVRDGFHYPTREDPLDELQFLALESELPKAEVLDSQGRVVAWIKDGPEMPAVH